MPTDTPATPPHGYTPNEIARLLRCSADRIRQLIRSGELGAVNMGMSSVGRPRFVILPAHLETFQQAHSAAAPKPARRQKRPPIKDYFGD